MTAVNEHCQVNRFRTSLIHQCIKSRSDRASRKQNVVNQDHVFARNVCSI